MRSYSELGDAVDRSWARAGRDPGHLPAIAAAALRELDDRALPDPIAIAGRCAADGNLPRQLPVDFGDAQVTVWRGDHLLVQLIYWLDETTPVHQHGFPGAFRVVRGASLHATYRFESREAIGPAFRVGTLTRDVHELLVAGDVREIGPGDALIHNLVHIERPSVTLAVRTPFLAALAPQWVYHPPGVAIDPEAIDPERRARIKLFAAQAQVDPRGAVATGRALIALGLDASWDVLVAIARRPPALAAPYLAMIRRQHGANGRVLIEAAARMQVRARLFQLRRTVAARPHRALLALLGDGGDRETILATIAQLDPRTPPAAQLERWLLELGGPLGIDLDPTGARVLRRTIEGATPKLIAAELRAQKTRGYPPRVVGELATAFRRSPLFAPLFRRAVVTS